jgi:hypothetical protein
VGEKTKQKHWPSFSGKKNKEPEIPCFFCLLGREQGAAERKRRRGLGWAGACDKTQTACPPGPGAAAAPKCGAVQSNPEIRQQMQTACCPR